ncbi:hypothetical protein JG687_00018088 [Phytophthora cactorum]|uniref:Uncharacterized protein n=1 Tax=Phytophthora cactorum TaxID=29920 RepID=A0A8T1TPU3_9STRA|nr:hypothetical protein JG687_00018088 [Phytophthora cactorum]
MIRSATSTTVHLWRRTRRRCGSISTATNVFAGTTRLTYKRRVRGGETVRLRYQTTVQHNMNYLNLLRKTGVKLSREILCDIARVSFDDPEIKASVSETNKDEKGVRKNNVTVDPALLCTF